VREAIDIPWSKHKAAAQLKRIWPQFVLTMPGGAGAFAALEIVAPKKMQDIGHPQIGYAVGLAPFVDEQRKIDARLFLKNPRIAAVTQADGRQRRTSLEKFVLVCAQLRDMLAAKNSSIMPQKYHHRSLILPQRAQPNFAPQRVG
jgi:hypothetical protein